MNKKDLKKIENLIERIECSSSKADAAPNMRELRSIAASIKAGLDMYGREKLDNLMAYADCASGSVRNKDQAIVDLRTAWSLFESAVEGFLKPDDKAS